MARTIGMESLELKIKKAQETVVKAKHKYDIAVADLSDLMNKRDALKKEQLISAILKSEKTYEEVLAFLSKTTVEEQ
jgi:hypothetical protein